MNNNEVEIIDADITDLTARPQNNGGLLDTTQDNISYLADRADEMIEKMNKIMNAALKATTEYDWVLIGGKPYLQESGATKVARLFGISWQMLGNVIVDVDREGYKTFTYKARFMLRDQFIECEGSRSMKDPFFSQTKNGLKKPDEIDERNVKMSAYTNCINNGIKRLIPNLRNIDVSVLEAAGLETGKIEGYTFKTGSKGGSSKKAEDTGFVCEACQTPVDQKVASYSQSYFGGHIYCRDCQKKAKANA